MSGLPFQAAIQIPALSPAIRLSDKVMLVGSCFTEHIGNHLVQSGMTVVQNPHGILFDPLSACGSLQAYMQQRSVAEEELFLHNELWHHWQFHTRYSHPDKETAAAGMNRQLAAGHRFLKEADWLLITLGSSFNYRLVREDYLPVANCHKYPGIAFQKHLCTIEETVTALDGTLHQLFRFNPKIQVLFTISPVRHLRDGVVENNRSKARLIEAVHHLVNKFGRLHYFPAYELVVDVLRDYRFYDVDLAHPNYAATRFVIDHFINACFEADDRTLAEKVNALFTASRHRSEFPGTEAHQRFLRTQLSKAETLTQLHPWLQLDGVSSRFREQLVWQD